MNSKVQDIMTPDPVGVYFDQTIGDTARIMRDAQVGAVLVVNGDALAGVVTDRDLVVRGLEHLIKENAVRRLPVIDGAGQIVGMVSMGDLAVSADGDSPLAAVSQAQPNI
jgi:CBS domain-containing protein